MVPRGQWLTYWEEVFWVKFVYRTQREWSEREGEQPATPIHIDLLISFAGLQWVFFFFCEQSCSVSSRYIYSSFSDIVSINSEERRVYSAHAGPGSGNPCIYMLQHHFSAFPCSALPYLSPDPSLY